jgi:hypothetical protein
LSLARGGNDAAKIVIGWRAADRQGAFNLKSEGTRLPGIVKINDKVIHWITLATPLDGDAGNKARLSSGAFMAQQVCQEISDDRVFVGEARTTG